MAMAKTSSCIWKEKGNSFYTTTTEDLSLVLRKERLRSATNCYYKAFNYSVNEDEKASAAKNLAMASWKTAQLNEDCDEKISTLIHTYKEAFKYFSLGLNHSKGIKAEVWTDGLLAAAKACWEETKSGKIWEQEIDDRAHIYHDLVHHIDIPEIKAECYIELANYNFTCGLTAIEKKDFKKGLYEMKECYMPINEAKRLLGNKVHDTTEVHILEEDVFLHQSLSEAMQARYIGDQLYEKLIMDEQSLNMDMVYEVIDWYKQAILRTREITVVEMEAIALSRLGHFYDKVLKLKYKAKEYLIRAMQLALSMQPRSFNSEDWFKDCKEILERYQKETVQAEEEQRSKEREEIMKEIAKEMKDIAVADEGLSEDFLRYIYRVFPPKNPMHKLEGLPREEEEVSGIEHDILKKTLQKAVIHYHPDKVDTEKHGKAWKVLSEEITKRMTARYEQMK